MNKTVTSEKELNFNSPMIDIAIVGAGPYGLSLAAYLKRKGISFRIFGRPMDSWLRHMPKGMLLKSDGFASTVADPDLNFTLKHFCAEKGIAYADMGIPVRLDTFSAYGLAFRDRLLPELEDTLVTQLRRNGDGFTLQLEDGQVVAARRVVLAIGITHFQYMPPNLTQLPSELVSHSFEHHDLEPFRGRKVAVIGGGSSAIDMAALLHDNGCDVHLVARARELRFHEKQQMDKPRSLWERLRHPQSGIGPGLKSRFFANSPGLFHWLPQALRLMWVRTHLGPAGGWFAKEKIQGRVPLMLGQSVKGAEARDGKVQLELQSLDGQRSQFCVDHVVAATGYRVDLERLKFLSDDLREEIKTVDKSPALSSDFESSVPGLYFVGVAAANSFGPVMRFAFGATFAATRVTRGVVKSLAKNSTSLATARVATNAN